MKFNGLLFFYLLAVGVVINGCNKITISEEIAPAKIEENLKSDWTISESLQIVWFEDGSHDWFCLTPPVNCLPKVEVKASFSFWDWIFGFKKSTLSSTSDSTAYAGFLSAIDNGTIDDYFSGSDYSQLFPYLDDQDFSDYLDILQTDTVRIISTGMNSDSVFRFIVLGVNDNSIVPAPEDTYMTLQLKFVKDF